MKYRDNMTPEELEQFKREIDQLNEAYAAAQDAANTEPIPEEYEDPSDYAGMGWVGKDGRP